MFGKLEKPLIRLREDVKEKPRALGEDSGIPKKDAEKPLDSDVNQRDDNTHQATHQGTHQGNLFGKGEVGNKTDGPARSNEVSEKGEEYYKIKAEMDQLIQTERNCNTRIRQLEKKLANEKLPKEEAAAVQKELSECQLKAEKVKKDIHSCQKRLGKLANVPAEVATVENDLNGEQVERWITLDLAGCRDSRTPVNGY